jgi:hypothetical protein
LIIIDGTMGRMVPATGVYGVIPANFAALGTSPSPLANDADLPGDANTQWMWMLKPALPGVGTTQANDAGGYAFFGAPPGLYTQDYRGFTVSPSGVVVVYDTTIPTTITALTTAVQQDLPLAWALKAGVTLDRAIAWSVRNAAQADRSLAWVVASTAQRDLQLAWDILPPYVISDMTISYDVIGTVLADLPMSYAIRAGVSRDRLMRWAVRSSVTQKLRRFKVTLQTNSTIK